MTLGSAGAHVPAGDRRGEAQQSLEVHAQRDGAADVDERIRGDFFVDDHRRALVAAEVASAHLGVIVTSRL